MNFLNFSLLTEIKAKLRIRVEARYPCMALSFTLLIRARLSSQTVERKRFTSKVRKQFRYRAKENF